MTHRIELNWVDPRIAVVMFRDDQRRNQLCWAAVDELASTIDTARDSGARVVILASDLAGYWLYHAWLADLLAGLDGKRQTGTGIGWFKAQEALGHPDIISIAAISGATAGGGAELGWACDLRIAEAQATFAQPEVDLGLTTGIGGCSRLRQLAGRTLATEMVLTGEPQSAQRLFELGVINRVVPTGQALSSAIELAGALAQKPAAATRGLKQILAAGDESFLADALAREQAVFQEVVSTDDARNAMQAQQARYDAQD